MRYPIILQKDPDSDYGVTVPDLAGCFSAGENMESALENAEEAILTHIEGLLMDNDPIPSPSSIDSLKKRHREKDIVWGIVSVDLSKLSERARRINITVPEKLLTKIDSFAEKEGETRSGLLVSAALEYIAGRSVRE
jgi:predicted RNase H-like HicB family nuclease